MGTLLQNPSNVPVSVSADWETLVNTNAAGNAGKNMLSMTNWDGGTLAPSVAAGSIIEIGGSLAYFETEQLPGGIATGINYLKFTVSGTTVTPVWTLTAPTWDAAKGGWYSGSDRYSGHRLKYDGSSYTLKTFLDGKNESSAFSDAVGDNLNLRVKKITATRAVADAGIAHGLDYTKIIFIGAAIQWSAGGESEWQSIGGNQVSGNVPAYILWSSTKVYLDNIGTGYTNVKLLIYYEE